MAYKIQNDFAATLNGGSVATDTVGDITTIPFNRLLLGVDSGGSSQLNGHISQLLYYPVRLSNSQLQTLTK